MNWNLATRVPPGGVRPVAQPEDKMMNNGAFPGLALLLLTLPLAAQSRTTTGDVRRGPTPKSSGAPTRTHSQGDFMRLRIDGQTNKARTRRVLDELVWHRTMASATSSARRKGRPIVVFQALGDIRGLC